jgi:ribose transport system ATP-binding protein
MSADAGPTPASFLSLRGITKRFGGVTALQDVDFGCNLGAIHAVLGENGAGKSTLIKVIAGVVRPDSGTMTLDGNRVAFAGPAEANAAGIVCIFQELSLIQDLTVADNISLADPPRRLGLIDRRAQRRRAEAALARVGCEDINPIRLVRDLPLSRRQMVEIAKALVQAPRVLILDEATSALTAEDVEKVFATLRRLRDEGLAILTISHRMHEIEALADACSVFRNGMHIATFTQGDRTRDEIVTMMVGRDVAAQFPPKPAPTVRKPRLELRSLGWENRLADIDLTLGEGEIVGLGGLDGQGQKELLLALFGVLRGVDGEVRVDGRRVRLSSPASAKARGKDIALIPEDRKTEGLTLAMSISDNLLAASLARLSRGPFLDGPAMRAAVDEAVASLRIKVGSVEDAVSTLSGGNQQKVVIAKWLMTGPRVVLLNDPTRGIDVGTKQEIYRLLRQIADAGASILFYTTDYEELKGCCDRVVVMYDGRIVRELAGEAITERAIIASALNITEGVPA